MNPMTELAANASTAAAIDELARDYMASCPSDTSESSDDEVEPTTEIEFASSTREDPHIAQLRVLSTQYGREINAYEGGCKYQNYTILELRLSIIDGAIEYMTQQQKILRESQEKTGRFQEELIDAANHIKQLSKENELLYEKRRVLEMVMGRLESRNKDLIRENWDLMGRLGATANGDTEPDTTNGSHKRIRDAQAGIDSNMEVRPGKRARQATAKYLGDV